MAERKVGLDFKDFEELGKFVEGWSRGISRAEKQDLLTSPEIIEAVANFIGEEIAERTDNNAFALFMADRTYVEAVNTSKGITFKVGGYTEREMMERGMPHRLSETALQEGKDYNLWEMYEFKGRVVGGETDPTGKPKKIVKDAGGVITVKKRSGETVDLKGRAGLISAVVSQLKQELVHRITGVLEASAAGIVAQAGVEAANKAPGLEGLKPALKGQITRQARELDIEIGKLSNLTISSGGTLRMRGAGGRFVASPVSKIRVNVKK